MLSAFSDKRECMSCAFYHSVLEEEVHRQAEGGFVFTAALRRMLDQNVACGKRAARECRGSGGPGSGLEDKGI